MAEITIKITEAQLKILIAMLNQVQVRLTEAPDFIDLKKRLDAIEVTPT
jgi:hypothetical protein